MAQICSSGAQSQLLPFCAHTPWPYCVILPAIQLAFGNAAMMSQTSCVLPMLRVCPPTTITRQRKVSLTSLPFQFGFQLFDARGQFRETRLPGELLFEFVERTSRSSPNCLAAANRFTAENAGLAADDSAIFKATLFAKTSLAANHDVFAEIAGAR